MKISCYIVVIPYEILQGKFDYKVQQILFTENNIESKTKMKYQFKCFFLPHGEASLGLIYFEGTNPLMLTWDRYKEK